MRHPARFRSPFLSWSAYAAVFLLCVACGTELALRFSPARPRLEGFLRMHRGMWEHFLAAPTGNPLLPPFVVFADTGLDDAARLRRIAEHARLPRSAVLNAPDFLRPIAEAERTTFQVRTNSLGFRDPERRKQKPPRTFRVICLGAYVTFGHAVEDDEAFPRVLEKRLNAQRGSGVRFEVWNAGRQASPAVHGLALLETELFDYRPDLLVLEYGFVDKATVADQFTPVALRLPDGPAARSAFRALRFAADLATRSYLLAAAAQRLQQAYAPRNISRWMRTMRRIIAAARERGIPVILLDQLGSLGPPKPLFEKLASGPGLRYCSLDRAFQDFPPSPEQIREWRDAGGWSSEWEDFTRIEGLPRGPFMSPLSYAPYLTNFYHPNRWGQRAVARMLETPVREAAALRKAAR